MEKVGILQLIGSIVLKDNLHVVLWKDFISELVGTGKLIKFVEEERK